MSASSQLDRYLEAFSRRLKRLTILQGTAAIAVVVLLVSVIGAWFATESGNAGGTVIAFRLLLLAALAAVIVRFIAWPLRRIKRDIGHQVEHRSPDFDGRVQTYLEMKEKDHPFRDLLAEDALKVSDAHPVRREVDNREFALAGTLAAAAAAILVYLLLAGPGMLNFSLRNLLAGWAVDDLLPPQSIAVLPGDESVRRGANLRIASTMDGFDPEEAIIHVRSPERDWQEVDMVSGPGGFEFTFFSLQQPMEYYVSAGGVRSPAYDINVVDIPSIENLSLTYHYPEWTDREPETIEPGGDIRTLPDTRIELNVTTTAPLPEGGQLMLNQQGQDLEVNGIQASTDFTITDEGEYFLTARVGGEQVRLSDDYFIRLTEDGKPSIEFTRPGRDWNASNIEEVTAMVEASDDFGLDAVELKYSINGGEWRSVDLAQEDSRTISAGHVFMLEDMRTPAITPSAPQQPNLGRFRVVLQDDPSTPGIDESSQGSGNAPAEEAAAPEPEMVPLQPGDLISYYAQASDRTQTARTDMFFIQVQQYNRRYSQSQLSGGGGGGGGMGQQDEISQRQRQIIVSTWNLIREQSEGGNAGTIEVNSSLLSDLQNTLKEQAQTLAERTRARQLTSQDEQIAQFVQSVEQAVQSMQPAAERLAQVELDEAIGPAQTALQHLLRAEAVFNEITISQQQGGGGGGGGNASRDLAEMFELEMDMEKNQYETGNRASPQQQQQEAEDIMDQLDELARRQEQLANNLRNQQQMSEAQRYQQDMLRREAEELRERLEQLQRNQQGQQGQQQGQQQASNGQQQGQQGQQGQQQGQQGQQGQQSGQGGQQQGGQQEGEQVAQSELQRRLESAIRAMNESSEAMRGNPSMDELQRSTEEAQRQLEGARDQVAADQMASLQESFRGMAEQSEQMLREQERMAQRLQDAMQQAVADRESGEDANSRGMELEEEWELARQKQELAGELQNLQQQMLNSMQRFEKQAPEATNEVQRANDGLVESELEQAISDAALYIDSGYGLYIAGNESNVTQAMRNLADGLERAQRLAEGAGARDTDLDRARRQAQDLRAALQESLARGGQPGQQGQQQGQGQQGQQQNQQGQGQQQGQQGQQGGQPGQQAGNGGGGGAFGGPRNGGNGWANADDLRTGPVDLPENFYDNLDQLTQAARDAIPQMNLGGEDLAAMYDLVRELEFTRVNRNDSILAGEYSEMLSLVEQLEVGLQREGEDRDRTNVRTAVQEAIPEEYKDAVAEYYRRLSQDN